jgi:hypothetical protein
MNPYTGGYDLCLEVSEDVLSAFVGAAVGGKELFVPVQFAGMTGLVHLLIDRAELSIDPSHEAGALVTVTFRDSSVRLALPGTTGPVGPLAGELIVGAPFSLSPLSNDPDLGTVRGIQVDLSLPAGANPDPVTVDVAPDPASLVLLDQLLAPTGLGFAAAAPLISAAVRAELALEFGVVPLGNLAIPVTDGGDGTLGVTLSGSAEQARFGRLELASVGPDDDGRPGVLALLAAVRATAQGVNREAKTGIVTSPGQRAGLLLSAEAFRREVFCALLTEALDGTDFPLPPPCGTTSDGLLRVAQDRFTTGAIVFEFRAGTEGTGWSARASLSATLSIELVNGVLVPRVRARPADVDLDIDTWVEVLGAIFAAPLLAAAEAAVAAAEGVFKRLIDRAVGEALKSIAGQIQTTLNASVRSVGLDSLRLTGVAINRYGIAVQLQVTTPSATRLNPILAIHVDSRVSDLGVVHRGTESGLTCKADVAYAYEDHRRRTVITLTAVPQELGDLVTYEWAVNGDDVEPGTSEQFLPARTYDGSELPERGRIQRILSENGVQLTINHSPPEGNLNLFVQCVARNAAGREAARGEVLTITDHQRQFESSYAEDLAACVQHLVDGLGRGPVRWPPDPDDPEEWRDRLIKDHLGPLIQRDSVSRAGAVQLSSVVGLLAAGGRQGWLEQLRPDLSGAMSSRLVPKAFR